jgi:hypothetical protein
MIYPRHINLKTFPKTDVQEMNKLTKCMTTCRACAKKCIEDDNHRLAFLCLDCSEICDLAIKLTGSDSDFCPQVFALCAQACIQCANECDRFQNQPYQECEEACRHCAEICSDTFSYR